MAKEISPRTTSEAATSHIWSCGTRMEEPLLKALQTADITTECASCYSWARLCASSTGAALEKLARRCGPGVRLVPDSLLIAHRLVKPYRFDTTVTSQDVDDGKRADQ